MKLIIKNENVLNVPNAISLYRLIMFFPIMVFAYSGNESLFVIFFCINLVSDILDGFIARYYKLTTKFGANLDNLADMGLFISAIYGIIQFKWEELEPHLNILYVFFSLLLLTIIISLFKFKKMPGLHLYLSVSSAYLQGIFFFVLFVWGFFPWLFYLSLGVGIVAYIEKLFVLLSINEIKEGTKGLYWVLKEKNNS